MVVEGGRGLLAFAIYGVGGCGGLASAKAHGQGRVSNGALPDKMRRDAKSAEALLPRMNAGAPTERQEEVTSYESRGFLLVGFFVFDVALGVGVDGVLVGVG